MTEPRLCDIPESLRAAFDPDGFGSAGRALVDRLVDQLRREQDRGLAVLRAPAPDELLARFDEPVPDGPAADGDTRLTDLLEALLEHSNQLHHPGYMGHQISVPFPRAALLELVNALLSNGMAVYEMGALQTVMERRVVEFLNGVLGLPDGAGGVLTHGGSLGNLTALLAARQARAGHDVWVDGQREPMAVLVSAEAHYSVARAVQIMGWGREGAWPVPTDARRRLDPDALPAALAAARAAGRRVIAVVASCCSTATGSFDPLPPVADFCAEHDLWLHVDGAHGASVALSARHRELVDGIARADSVVWDLHKLMGLPALNTAVLFREGHRAYEAFAQRAEYLFDPADPESRWFDVGQRTLECTKRGLGTTAYVMLQLLGRRTFEELVDTLLERAAEFAQLVQAADDFELALPPQVNIVCFRLRPAGSVPGEALDALQARLRATLVAGGTHYIVQTRLDGELWLRVTLMNPLTTHADLTGLLAALRDLQARPT